jgi:hypothetical protein
VFAKRFSVVPKAPIEVYQLFRTDVVDLTLFVVYCPGPGTWFPEKSKSFLKDWKAAVATLRETCIC